MSDIQDQPGTKARFFPGGSCCERPSNPPPDFWRAAAWRPGFLPVLLTLVVVVLFFEFTTDGVFLTPRNLSFLAQQLAELASLAWAYYGPAPGRD